MVWNRRFDQNQPKSAVLSGFGALPQLPDAPTGLIVAESKPFTHSDPRSYTYFEIVSGPGPSRQLLGGNGAIYWLIPIWVPPLLKDHTVRIWSRFGTWRTSACWVDPLSTSVRIDRIPSNTIIQYQKYTITIQKSAAKTSPQRNTVVIGVQTAHLPQMMSILQDFMLRVVWGSLTDTPEAIVEKSSFFFTLVYNSFWDPEAVLRMHSKVANRILETAKININW